MDTGKNVGLQVGVYVTGVERFIHYTSFIIICVPGEQTQVPWNTVCQFYIFTFRQSNSHNTTKY